MAKKHYDNVFDVYIKGYCVPNPDGEAGAGCYIELNGNEYWAKSVKISAAFGNTINTATVEASTQAFKFLLNVVKPKGYHIRFHFDLMYALGEFTGYYDAKHYEQLVRELLPQLVRYNHVTFDKIKGEDNVYATMLAKSTEQEIKEMFEFAEVEYV